MTANIKTAEQIALDVVQDFIEKQQDEITQAYLEMCLFKAPVFSKVLSNLLEVFPSNLCNKDGEPLIVRAIYNGVKKAASQTKIASQSCYKVLLDVTRNIVKRSVEIFGTIRVKFKDFEWNAQKAVLNDLYLENRRFMTSQFTIKEHSVSKLELKELFDFLIIRVMTRPIYNLCLSDGKKESTVDKAVDRNQIILTTGMQ